MIAPLTGKARRSLHASTARFNLWEGAVRSSKTVASTFAWMRYTRRGPGGNLVMIGKTERTLKRNVLDPIIDMVGSKRARYLGGSGEFHLFGRRIYTAGANDIKSVEKIQGLTLAGAYGDEIATWPEELFNMLGTRMSIPGAQMFGTCNPAGPAHWLKTNWLDRAAMWIDHEGDTHLGDGDALDLNRYSFTLDDNPHLPPDFVESLKKQYFGLFYKRYILGLWVPAEGAIYGMWDPKQHVVTTMPTIVRSFSLGIDHGTLNPFAGIVLGLGADGNLYLYQEWRWDSKRRQQQLTDVEYSQRLRQWLKDLGIVPEWWVVDPSALSFRTQLLADGIVTHPADNSVLDGIRLVASLFALGVLKVHKGCEGLIAEIPGYTWDPDKAEKGEDAPIKLQDHSCDAMRYAIKTPEVIWRPHIRLSLALAA